MPRVTVMIADDHPVVLESLVNLLKDTFDVAAAVADGNRLVEAALRFRPDVIVTDISMPGLNGMEALGRLKASRSETKVIVLTMHVDVELAVESILAGASGFVVKMLAGAELVNAIHHVMRGGVYLTGSVADEVIAGLSRSNYFCAAGLAVPGGLPSHFLNPVQT
jgi:DNA-binding NarL/FixJ family response regulator